MTPDRQPAFFVADSLGLDFLNSVATPVDRRLIGSTVATVSSRGSLRKSSFRLLRCERYRTGVARRTGQCRRTGARLREWFRISCASIWGGRWRPEAIDDLRPLNRLLERDERFSQIGSVGQRRRSSGLETMRRWRSPESLLLPIAEAWRDRVRRGLRQHQSVRGPPLHPDLRRPHKGRARRWCSMATCGNRAKQAAHRHRLKGER